MSPPIFRAYIDESGDRGNKQGSSDVFVMSALMVRDEDERTMLTLLDSMNTSLGRKPTNPLHWATNLRGHDQRKFVVAQIAASPAVLTNVVVVKRRLAPNSLALSDPNAMYRYAARRILERISWYVDEAGGRVTIRFAHVKRFPYQTLRDYLALLRTQPTEIRWDALMSARYDRPENRRLLQAADIVAGTVNAAMGRDVFGQLESCYLETLAARLYVRKQGPLRSYGLNLVGDAGCEQDYPWWPTVSAACGARL